MMDDFSRFRMIFSVSKRVLILISRTILPPPGLLMMIPFDSRTRKASRSDARLMENFFRKHPFRRQTCPPGFNSLLLIRSSICSVTLSYSRTGIIFSIHGHPFRGFFDNHHCSPPGRRKRKKPGGVHPRVTFTRSDETDTSGSMTARAPAWGRSSETSPGIGPGRGIFKTGQRSGEKVFRKALAQG